MLAGNVYTILIVKCLLYVLVLLALCNLSCIILSVWWSCCDRRTILFIYLWFVLYMLCVLFYQNLIIVYLSMTWCLYCCDTVTVMATLLLISHLLTLWSMLWKFPSLISAMIRWRLADCVIHFLHYIWLDGIVCLANSADRSTNSHSVHASSFVHDDTGVFRDRRPKLVASSSIL